jgi:aspartyl-tRNA(Asn)/glutamyl-tRNA(Gln) amidotransferase subunit B
LGTRAEIKNMNSVRSLGRAVEYEIARQIDVVESGGRVVQETRHWDEAAGVTHAMRSKEHAHDYRYFPEPDLLPVVVDAAWQEEICKDMPELPEARRGRMISEYGIAEADAVILTGTRTLADQFEEAARAAKNPKRVANLVLSELAGRLKAKGLEIEQSPISMKGVAMSADLVEEGKISGKILKDLYDKAFEGNEDFPAVYEREKPQQISDTSAIEKMIDEVIAASPKQVEGYKAGKKTLAGFFVGQVMKMSKGQANPALVNEILAKKLEG